MELSRAEMSVVENAEVIAAECQLRELSELQLVLVGGGIGETVL